MSLVVRDRTLNKDQRESLFLVNVGTFLEYFDFKTYIHITVLLNTLFFPSTDPYTKSLLTAFSFSMAYLLRPIGSLIFGLLGDYWGRRNNIILTTMGMSIATFFLGCMPTYDQAGINASIGVIICRIIQGISAAVEVTGATVYVTEIIRPPQSYFYAGLVGVAAILGQLFALFCCSTLLILRPDDGWRYVFFLGSAIAVVGLVARTRLKETPEFIKVLSNLNVDQDVRKPFIDTMVRYKRNSLAHFLVCLLPPFSFFVGSLYIGEILMQTYGFTPNQIISRNFFIILVDLFVYILTLFATRYLNPLKIIKISGYLFLCVAGAFPYIMKQGLHLEIIFIIQCLLISLLTVSNVGAAIFARGFPVVGRYTLFGLSYSLARALAALGTSYGCVLVGERFGIDGISWLLIVIGIFYMTGLYLFVPCEEDRIYQNLYSVKK